MSTSSAILKQSKQTGKTLILASQSPRRRELLLQLGYQFSTQASDIDESTFAGEPADEYVSRLAKDKAMHVYSRLSSAEQKLCCVLGSDTSVVIDGNILGKPSDLTDCIKTLTLLSDNQHQVLTAIALVNAEGVKVELVTTKVTFKKLSQAEIQAYWLTGEPQDKAGSYGIQGIAGQFVTNMQGSYSAVVGLPLYETAQLLNSAGLVGAINANHLLK